jgi:hypothetical protein
LKIPIIFLINLSINIDAIAIAQAIPKEYIIHNPEMSVYVKITQKVIHTEQLNGFTII